MIKNRLIGLILSTFSLMAVPSFGDEGAVSKAVRKPPSAEVPTLPGPCDWTMNTNGKRIVPLSFFDDATRIVLYVESDGRHVAAINPEGRILWVRNPFVEAHLCPYRVSKPVIVSIEQSSGDTGDVVVRYDSSQFGTLRKKSGEFTPGGQN